MNSFITFRISQVPTMTKVARSTTARLSVYRLVPKPASQLIGSVMVVPPIIPLAATLKGLFTIITLSSATSSSVTSADGASACVILPVIGVLVGDGVPVPLTGGGVLLPAVLAPIAPNTLAGLIQGSNQDVVPMLQVPGAAYLTSICGPVEYWSTGSPFSSPTTVPTLTLAPVASLPVRCWNNHTEPSLAWISITVPIEFRFCATRSTVPATGEPTGVPNEDA